MTAQLTDTLLHEGQSYSMYTTPLSGYFALSGLRLQLQSTMTCNWRGYLARWETVDGRLYLVAVSGTLAAGKLMMHHIFPGFPERVFAHWYTGEIRLPYGPQLRYVHMGFMSVYAYELVLDFEQGVVRGQRLVDNALDQPPREAPRAKGMRARLGRFFSRFGGAA